MRREGAGWWVRDQRRAAGRLDELSAAKNSDDTRSSHWSDDDSDDEKRGSFDRIMWSESNQESCRFTDIFSVQERVFIYP